MSPLAKGFSEAARVIRSECNRISPRSVRATPSLERLLYYKYAMRWKNLDEIGSSSHVRYNSLVTLDSTDSSGVSRVRQGVLVLKQLV